MEHFIYSSETGGLVCPKKSFVKFSNK